MPPGGGRQAGTGSQSATTASVPSDNGTGIDHDPAPPAVSAAMHASQVNGAGRTERARQGPAAAMDQSVRMPLTGVWR